MGFEHRDDAGVYRLNQETALIQTVDFFTPMVDDPYIFGQIAACNALNDVYAMGGKPILAMNLVCFPQCEDISILGEILAGGLDKIKESGALLVGGHSVDDMEPKYGLAVTGLVDPERVISNNQAKLNDILYLTKPLGNGVITTTIKAEMASEEATQEAITWMSTLNKDACEIMQEFEVKAATDVTGFGLIGHLYELASASDVSIEIDGIKIPFMNGVIEYANMGLIPGGAYNNRDYFEDKVEYLSETAKLNKELLFSPETAGGLLIALAPEKKAAFELKMQENKVFCVEIGRVVKDGFKNIRIR